MSTMISAVAAPLPAFARAAAFAVLAIAMIGMAELWHRGVAADPAEPAPVATEAAQPLVMAPTAADMWHL
ncbi:MAG TPA: hypothetical protein VGV37_11625 [Aliidongia sp.]|uniref:hypothetical protein n=1 Tax=Aliidongia sp. TaxID=1914230 RepID=UPI002DDD0059|nr:hypothetical protein [Aliidongia sp.]HEV2675181.1 hypothetical protein [Aliidongia sp.]